MATVRVANLQCEVTYYITAGGTLNGDLVGTRSFLGTITVGPCPVMMTTTMITASMTGKIDVGLKLCCVVLAIGTKSMEL